MSAGKIIITTLIIATALVLSGLLTGCESKSEKTEIQVFVAASLKRPMEEIAAGYNEQHPNVAIVYNIDGSGKLMTQIEEGYSCDVFFSASAEQMNRLEEDNLLIDGTRSNVVNNQLVVISRRDSNTAVTGLSNLNEAESIAIAGGSVPAGGYTRRALINIGVLSDTDDVSEITTAEMSDALGGVEISEQDNVSKVLTAVAEGSCEVGTTYLSDTYGYEDELNIIEIVPYDLTGNVIYPVSRVKNDDATDEENSTADDFIEYILSDEARSIFEKYYFDTNI